MSHMTYYILFHMYPWQNLWMYTAENPFFKSIKILFPWIYIFHDIHQIISLFPEIQYILLWFLLLCFSYNLIRSCLLLINDKFPQSLFVHAYSIMHFLIRFECLRNCTFFCLILCLGKNLRHILLFVLKRFLLWNMMHLEIKIATYYILVLSKNRWSKPACVNTSILEYIVPVFWYTSNLNCVCNCVFIFAVVDYCL